MPDEKMPEEEQQPDPTGFAVLYGTPVHYCNHVHMMLSEDDFIFEFRSAIPSIFGSKEGGGIQFPLPEVIPFSRMVMTKKAAKRFCQEFQQLLARNEEDGVNEQTSS